MPKPRFQNGLLNIFFLICFKCLPLTLTFAKKQLFWTFLTSREIEIIEEDAPTETTNRWTKLILWHFLANVNVDAKHLKQIKEINTWQCLLIVHCGNRVLGLVADEEWSENEKNKKNKKRLVRGSRWKADGGCFSYNYDRVGGVGRLLLSLSPVKVNLADYLGESVGSP